MRILQLALEAPNMANILTRNSARVTIPPTDANNCFNRRCVRNMKNTLAKNIWITNFSNSYSNYKLSTVS